MKRSGLARGLGFAIGLMTFAGTHAIEVARWSSWFGGEHDPWFLNSGRAIVFTLTGLLAVSLVAGILRLSGIMIAAGGATAMTIVLALAGGSTIFPIVLAAGGLLISAASLFGAWLGSEIGRWLFSNG